MTHEQRLNSTIKSREATTIDVGLMAAARDNAHQIRSEAIRQGFTLVYRTILRNSRALWHRPQSARRKSEYCTDRVTA